MQYPVSDNPLSCTCDIEKLRKWIDFNTNTWLQTGLYNCATPESLLGISVSEVELDCRSFTPFYISVSIPFVILFCVLIIFLIRYRWHIKYKLFFLCRNDYPFPENNEDFEMLRLQYHAYIAYNKTSDDDAWVMNELQLNMEEGPESVKLCIKSRNFIPEHSLTESISENIQQSRKTILVLSPNFVESKWCYHEMKMAKSCLINLYWQKYIQAQQYIKQAKKDCTQKPRSCTMVINKGDHDTVQGSQKTKTKQQQNNSIYKKRKKMNIHATAMTKQLQLEVRLVCGPPGWFVASIPDGITREDGNLTEVFFE